MSLLDPKNLYHTGIIVEDVDAAAAALSRSMGYTWTKPAEGNDRPVVYADGTEDTLRLRYCYSIEAPHLELVQAVPGTPWAATHRSLHHLGYWVDDLPAASAELAAAGFALVVSARDEHGNSPVRFAYHEAPDGTFIELVERTIFGKPFQEWLDTSERFNA